MNSIIERDNAINSGRPSLTERSSAGFLKDVIRRQWYDAIGTDKVKSHATAAEIDLHIANMNALIDPLDYEIHCIPRIVSHSKQMQKEEFARYLKQIEALATGYSSMLGKELTGLLLIGLTTKARSTKGVEKYHKMLSDEIDGKIQLYGTRIERRKVRIDRLSLKAVSYRRGIFSFFRRGKVLMLNKRIYSTTRRVEALNKKFDRLNGIKMSMKAKAAPSKPA